MRSIGIDIGSLSIKIADVVSTSQGFVLEDFVELPLSSEPGTDHKIEIINHLRKISGHYGQTGVKYVMSIPQEQASVRSLSFPFKERHNILKSLGSTLEDDIPFDQDDAVFDAKIVRTTGAAAEVLAIACPKKYVQEILQLAYDAGIDPDIVSVDGPATANLFENWSAPPREILSPKSAKEAASLATSIGENPVSAVDAVPPCQIVINIGHRRSLFSVFYRNTLLTSRTVSRGGHDIVEALRRAYSIPYTEALKGLQEKGFVLTSKDNASQDQIDFSDIVKNALKPLIEDIRLTIIETKSQFEVEINQLYISGGVSRMMNIAPYFNEQLEIASSLLKHVERVPKNMPNTSESFEYVSLVAISVALEGLKRPRNPPINLRRMEFGKQSGTLQNLVEKWGYTLKYAAIMLALLYVYSFSRDMFSESLETAARVKLQDVAKESFGLKGKAANESKLKQFIKEKKIEIEAKKDLEELQDINSVLDVINSLSEKFPVKSQVTVDVRRLLLKNENLTLEGEVSQKSHLDLIRNVLISQATDRKIQDMSPSIQASPGKLAFAFGLKVNRR